MGTRTNGPGKILAFATALAGASAGPAVQRGDAQPASQQPGPAPETPSESESRAEQRADQGRIVVDPVIVQGRRARRGGSRDLGSADPHARDAARAMVEPAFVTVVHLEDHEGETRSVAEALTQSVGANVRTLGGLGSFASISIRGASAAQTSLSVDGVPLSRIASAAADLGNFELETFDQIEVYRGAVPVTLGGAAMGGAVNFVTGMGRDGRGNRRRVATGVGSFGSRHLLLSWGDDSQHPAISYRATVGRRQTRGDYRFFDDNGTPLNPLDDRETDRQNNGFARWDAVARARYRGDHLAVEAGSRGLWKQQGVPGAAAVQSREASLATASQLIDVRVRKDHLGGAPYAAAGATAYAFYERQHFRDLLGEVGIGIQDQVHRTVAAGLQGDLSYFVNAHLVSAGGELRMDDYAQSDRLRQPAGGANGPRGQRLAAALSLGDDIAWGEADRWVVAPALRIDFLRTDPGNGWDPITADPGALGRRRDLAPSPRLAARTRLLPALTVKGSAGRYFRPPTVVELFGDRGFVVGNPILAAETGTNADLGLVWAPGAWGSQLDRVYGTAALFAARPRSVIAFVPTAAHAAVARNLGDATLWGLESAATLRLLRRLTVTANYTFLESRQRSPLVSFSGRRLPLRPRQQLYGRLDWAAGGARQIWVVWADVAYTSGNFFDAANLVQLPARLLVGAGIKAELGGGLLLSLAVKNANNQRVQNMPLSPPPRPDLTSMPRAVADFFGYPLPGRAYYLTLDWSF